MRYELRITDDRGRAVDRFVFFAPSDHEAGRTGHAMLAGREGELWRDAACVRRWALASA